MTAIGYKVFSGGDENILKLDYDNDQMIVQLNVLRKTELYNLNE